MSKIGRNDPCYCGSGKKYKKCCMAKENKENKENREMTEEIAEVDFAGRANVPKISTEIRGYGIFEGIEKGLDNFERDNLNILDEEYISNRRYAEEFGYPLTKYDFLNLELLNLTGCLMGSGEVGKIEGIEEILIKAGKRLKETEKDIIFTLKSYKDETGKSMNLEAKMDFKPFNIEKEMLPTNMRKENVMNFFYANIGLSFHHVISKEIEKKYGKKRADEIGGVVFNLITDYISRNCRKKCNDRCIKNMGQSGYCDICSYGRRKLLCPKEGEIGYNEIKATEKDMDEH